MRAPLFASRSWAEPQGLFSTQPPNATEVGGVLVGSTVGIRSDTFRTLWAAHNVRYHRTGIKRIHHPVVGDLELTYEAFELPADPGLQLSTFTAEPGSPSADALKMLASWAATADPPAPRHEVTAEDTRNGS